MDSHGATDYGYNGIAAADVYLGPSLEVCSEVAS